MLSRGPLPFAFLLAMAADAANGANSELIAPAKPLQPGSLAGLLAATKRSPAPPASEGRFIEGSVGTKVVQFFPNFPNFRNCFVGNWRNC